LLLWVPRNGRTSLEDQVKHIQQITEKVTCEICEIARLMSDREV